MMYQVVTAWFGSNNSKHPNLARNQSSFLDALAAGVPSDILPAVLLLPPVWDAFEAPHRWIVCQSNPRIDKKIADAVWDETAKQLRLLLDESEDDALLDDLRGLEYSADTCLFASRLRPPRLGTTDTTTVTSTSALASASVHELSAYRKLLDFLLAIAPLHEGSPTTVQDFISLKPNQRMPFRELGPDRKHLRQLSCFRELDLSQSLSVVRSLAVFRGLTFDAPAMDRHDGLFHTESDWQTFASSQAAEDLVNTHALGQWNDRCVDNFESIWTEAVKVHDFLVPSGHSFCPISFTKVNRFLGRKSKVSLPQFGKLLSMLYAEDLVYAGLAEYPPLEEFADFVRRLNKGAVSGMVALGVATKGAHKAARASGANQFKAIYWCVFLDLLLRYASGLTLTRFLDRELTETQKKAIHFDMFMVEHVLCKYSRWVKRRH